MASGLEAASGNDLDNILEFRGTSRVPDTGIEDINGRDICDRYEKASTGVEFNNDAGIETSNGDDIFRIFCRKGSANFAALTGTAFNSGQNHSITQGSPAQMVRTFTIWSNGNVNGSLLNGTIDNIYNGADDVAGAGDYEVQVGVSVNSWNNITLDNEASGWISTSSGRTVRIQMDRIAEGQVTRNFTFTIRIRRRNFPDKVVERSFNSRMILIVENDTPLTASWDSDLFTVNRIYRESFRSTRQNLVFDDATNSSSNSGGRLNISGGSTGTPSITYSIVSQAGGNNRTIDFGTNGRDLRAFVDLNHSLGTTATVDVVLRAVVRLGSESVTTDTRFRFRFTLEYPQPVWPPEQMIP